MSQRRLFRGPRCNVANCKSTRYYKVDGLTYCHNNHQATGVLEYQIDDDEAQASGFGSRRKRGPDLRDAPTEKQSKTHRGKLGYATYIQAYQLVMRLQAKFICEKLGVPSFQPLYRDLWRVFLQSQGTAAKLPESEDEGGASGPAAMEDLDPVTAESGSESAADVLPTDSEYESDGPETSPIEPYTDTRYTMHRPLLIHTIALSYLALLLLRVPITIHDFRSWIDGEEFPYMRSVRHIPEKLLACLEPQYYEALDPQIRPRPARIWKWTQQTARYLTLHTGLEYPNLNYRPILYTMIKNLLLPIDMYSIVDAQLELLGITMSIVFDQKAHMNGVPPEIRALCLLLVASKLVYNLDEVKRSRGLSSLPTYRRPNLAAWRHVIRLLITGLQGIDITSKVQPHDVLAMDGKATDEYLDWFTRTWVSNTPEPPIRTTSVPEVILQMFPLGQSAPKEPDVDLNPESERLKTVGWLYSQPYEVGDTHGLLPGSQYASTTPEPPLSSTVFDDLLELASLQHSIPNKELRKHIIWLERRLANIAGQEFKATHPADDNRPDVQRQKGQGSQSESLSAAVSHEETAISVEQEEVAPRTSDSDSDFSFSLSEEAIDSDP